MPKNVLITGARSAAALDIARDFAAEGWQVHLADSVHSRLARWSALPARHHSYPPPRQAGGAFRAAIADLIELQAIDLVIPTCEEVFHLAQPGLHAAMAGRLFAPKFAQLAMLHDKLAFARACEDWGLCVPESRPIETQNSLEDFQAESRKWVFKSRFGRFGEATIIAPSQAELKQIDFGADQNWMAQRLIRGDEVCLHAAAHRGELVHFAAYTSNWRLSGGACYAFEPLDPNRTAMLRGLAARLVEAGSLHGQFGFDAIIPPGGEPHFLECNPRATSGVHLMTGGGQLARAVADGTPAPMPALSGEPRTSYLAPAMLFFGTRRAIMSGRPREWVRIFTNGTDAITRPGDRLPALGAALDTAHFAVTGLRRGISTSAATTYDIEWNGEEFEP